MENKTSFTYKLTDTQKRLVTEVLSHGNYEIFTAEHTTIAARTPSCSILLYKSGKLLIQGKGASDFVMFVLEPLVLQEVALGYEKELKPEAFQPHMGIDESGKGDFFGPLVIASAYVDESLVAAMQELDVKDSKRITSDTKMLEIGRRLRDILGNRFAIIKIGPAKYNDLYTGMRSVNNILGWAHARAIENLLDAVPDCPRAISDQFGSKQQVTRALMKKGRTIRLEQMHKAESDLAVAAASILAREQFLLSLRDMAGKYGVTLPKGASAQVKATAAALVRKHGPAILVETAKCHFKTTDEVLKEAGHARKELGPAGQAVSKPYDNSRWKKKKESSTGGDS